MVKRDKNDGSDRNLELLTILGTKHKKIRRVMDEERGDNDGKNQKLEFPSDLEG